MKALTVGVAVAMLAMVETTQAVVIDFEGGTATLMNGSSVTTTDTAEYWNVDYYVEGGFKLDFIGNTGNVSDPFDAFSAIVGDYYDSGNSVIHGHWDPGNYGYLTEIMVTKLDGTAFDLNYFILTSNTEYGGQPATGRERAYIHAWDDTGITYSQLLPSDDWGWFGSNPQIFLGSEFDNVKAFSFTVANKVDCFGMDEFYINEPAPPSVPDGGATLVLLTLAMAGLAGIKRRK